MAIPKCNAEKNARGEPMRHVRLQPAAPARRRPYLQPTMQASMTFYIPCQIMQARQTCDATAISHHLPQRRSALCSGNRNALMARKHGRVACGTLRSRLAKQIGQKPSAVRTTVTQDAINPETQYADPRYEPDPAGNENATVWSARQLVSCDCIIEIYSELRAEDFRACLIKHLAAGSNARVSEIGQQEAERADTREDSVASFLWIIAAGARGYSPDQLKLERSSHWPRDSTFRQDCSRRHRRRSELPRDVRRLLVRLMRPGPPGACRSRSRPRFRRTHTSGHSLSRSCYSSSICSGRTRARTRRAGVHHAMLKSWEEGKAEARAETQANAVLPFCAFVASPFQKPRASASWGRLGQLERWPEKAIIALRSQKCSTTPRLTDRPA